MLLLFVCPPHTCSDFLLFLIRLFSCPFTILIISGKCLVDWRLTEEEQEIILDKMEEYCMQETGKTLQELWDSYEAE